MVPNVDPLFPEVFLLMPFSGSGDTLVDYSGQSANTSVVPAGTLTNGVFTQNSARTLFGLNTLQIQKPPPLASQYRFIINDPYPIAATDDLCFEFWIYQQSLIALAMSPQYLRFTQRSGAGIYLGQAININSNGSSASSPAVMASNPVINGQCNGAAVAGNWQYCVYQFVASESTLYAYWNSVPISRNFFPANTPLPWSVSGAVTGFRMILGYGGNSGNYDISMAQLRATKANRYGINAGNYLTNIPPVPTEAWPLTGP